ncbi:hypothetical protein ACEWY4_019647 [Coilia grayii]|uniref:Serine/threonine-protein kinase haspin n=1 Tax=Coilia grayii TaxID=363190 RepID=A0ABD1JBI7_9TELE
MMTSVTLGRNAGTVFMKTYSKKEGVRKVQPNGWLFPDLKKSVFSNSTLSDGSTTEMCQSPVQLKKGRRKKAAKPTSKAEKSSLNFKEGDSDEENVHPSVSAHKSTITRSDNSTHPVRGKFVTARRRPQPCRPRVPNPKPLVLCPSSTLNSSEDFVSTTHVLPRTVNLRQRQKRAHPQQALQKRRKRKKEEEEVVGLRSLNTSTEDLSLTGRAPIFSSTPSVLRHRPPRLCDTSVSAIFSTEDSASEAEPPRRGPFPPPKARPCRRLKKTPSPSQPHLEVTAETSGPLPPPKAKETPFSPSQPHLEVTAETSGPLPPPKAKETPSPSQPHLEVSAETSGLFAHPKARPCRRLEETASSSSRTCLEVSSDSTGAADGSSNGSVEKQPQGATRSRTHGPPAPAEQLEVEERLVQQSVPPTVTSPAGSPSPYKQPSLLQESPRRVEEMGNTKDPSQLEHHQVSLDLFMPVEEGDEAGDVHGSRDASQATGGFTSAKTSLDSLEVTTDADVAPHRRSELPSLCSAVSLAPAAITSLDDAGEMEMEMCREVGEEDDRATRHLVEELKAQCISRQPVVLLHPLHPSPALLQRVASPDPGCSASRRQAELETLSTGGGQGVQRLKARCISNQPVVLLEPLHMSPALHLSPALLRHGATCAAASPSAGGSPVPRPAEPLSASSDDNALPAVATLSSSSSSSSSSNSSAGGHVDPAPQQQESWAKRPKRCPKRKKGAPGTRSKIDSDGASSPKRSTLAAGRVEQQAGRVGTGRKACVSGVSDKRWTKTAQKKRDQGRKAAARSQNAHDSLDFGRAAVVTHAKGAATPALEKGLNISSLLACLSPDTSLSTLMWSRLKAALSLHKRRSAFITPHRLCLSALRTPSSRGIDVSQDICGSPALPLLPRLVLNSPSCSSFLGEENISDAEKVYQECQQDGPLTFGECIPPARMKCCRKIGEGTFGEVFSTTDAEGQPVALKIIPLEGTQKVNGEDQKSFGEILHEIIISKELSILDQKEENRTDGFIGLKNMHCVQGCYPKQLLSAWDKFDREQGSENDRPDFFGNEQFFLILEFEFGGSDLERMNGKLSSLAQAKSILQQVTAALAVAEQALCFEHRDLHWGNILVKTTNTKECGYTLKGESYTIETQGVQVNIIDYSLSRLEIDGLTVSCDISTDEELFMGQGDYQFDIYRKMREENENNWSEYHPHTNVLWLHYLTDKLLAMKYKGGARSAQARTIKSSLQSLHRDLLAFRSATEVLKQSVLFK